MYKESKNNWTNWHHLIHKFILNNKDFIPDNIQLLISVSGGQDSMALLNLLDDIKDQHEWVINVWHGDHKWHVKSSFYANELEKFCKKKNIIFYCDSARYQDVNNEENARNWRYKKLFDTAQKISNKNNNKTEVYIATGHTSTDNTETFLMHLARGSNLKGLMGVPRKRILNKKYYLVRPILIFSRKDTSSICNVMDVPFWEDPTNLDLTLKRNLIRAKIIYNLEKIYPRCSIRINNFMNRMSHLNQERSDLADLALLACTNENIINRQMINDICKEARSTILNLFLKKNFHKQFSSINIDMISEKIFHKKNGQIDLPNGFKIVWDEDYIFIKD